MPIITKCGRLEWRMKEPCDNCPFSNNSEGIQLRESLGSTRISGIEADLRKGKHFICHKTTDVSGKRRKDNMVCAGAIVWQAARGIKADLVQIMERLEIAKETFDHD